MDSTSSTPKSLLRRVRVVLVEPQGPRNVGSVARAMKNFGLRDLRIVGGPPLDHGECLEMGVGAHDLLAKARRVATLAEAIADATYVVGTTARRRRRLPTSGPAEAAPRLLEEAARGRTALLFGREDHGLFAEETRLCHEMLSIETSSARATLNLSQAVLLVAYELFRARPERAVSAGSDAGPVTDAAMLARLESELRDCCERSGYLHEGNRQAIEQSLTRLLRVGPIQTRDSRHVFALVRRMSAKLRRGEG